MPDITINNNTDKQITVKVVSRVMILKTLDSFKACRVSGYDFEPLEIKIEIAGIRDKQST